MSKFIRAFAYGALIFALIFSLSLAGGYIKLIAKGYDISFINSHIGNAMRGVFKGSLVGGGAIFLLALIGGPRQRPPH